MFSINCKQLQQILCEIRRALGIRKSACQPVTIHVDRESIIVRVTTHDASIACQIPGGGDKPETMTLPMQVLANVMCSPKRDISFYLSKAGVRLIWRHDDQEESETVENLPPVDDLNLAPEWLLSNHRRLGQTLQQAACLTDPDSSRYALGCIQLRGRDGQISASDGRQAFTESGFSFPVDEVLVPAAILKQIKCLGRCSAISVGRSTDWISLRMAVGPLRWLVDVKLASQGRFPNVDQCMPSDSSTRCTLTIGERDAEFLQSHLAKLYGKSNDIRPLTIDLGRDRTTGQQSVSLRFHGSSDALSDHYFASNDFNVATPAGGRCLVALAEQSSLSSYRVPKVERVELTLGSSHYDQLPMRIAMDYRYLLTALKLGFREINFGGEASPAWCVDGDRRYVWAALHSRHVQQTSPHAVVISKRRDLVAA